VTAMGTGFLPVTVITREITDKEPLLRKGTHRLRS